MLATRPFQHTRIPHKCSVGYDGSHLNSFFSLHLLIHFLFSFWTPREDTGRPQDKLPPTIFVKAQTSQFDVGPQPKHAISVFFRLCHWRWLDTYHLWGACTSHHAPGSRLMLRTYHSGLCQLPLDVFPPFLLPTPPCRPQIHLHSPQ